MRDPRRFDEAHGDIDRTVKKRLSVVHGNHGRFSKQQPKSDMHLPSRFSSNELNGPLKGLIETNAYEAKLFSPRYQKNNKA